MAKTIKLTPSSLVLDLQNPRLGTNASGQRQAIQQIAKQQERKLLALAKDIVQQKALNPAELPIVIQDPGNKGALKSFIVLEGNRRIAALKILENPEIVDGILTPALCTEFRKVGEEYQKSPLKVIECSQVDSREDANHWIELRHTGERQGAGIVPWDAQDSARFRDRKTKPSVATQVLDFLERTGHLDPESRKKVPVTTLQRLVGTPEVREKLAIDVAGGELHLRADEKKVAFALSDIAGKLADKTLTVSDLMTKQDRIAFAEGLTGKATVKPTLGEGQSVPVSMSSLPPANTESAKTRAGIRGNVGKKSKPSVSLIPPSWSASINHERIKKIAFELRSLPLSQYENAVSVLIRVFLELSVDQYAENTKLSGYSRDRSLTEKATTVWNDLQAKRQLNRTQVEALSAFFSNKNSPLAPDINRMHKYVHNPNLMPSPQDLRSIWLNVEPLLSQIWKA